VHTHGTDTEIRFAIGECSLGSILVARSVRGVCAISLGDDPKALARELLDRFPQASLIDDDAERAALVARVVDFVETTAIGLDLPLDVRGTPFQRRVWESVRAVAQACGANTLAVAIPCHRVVRRNGKLSGYRWGAHRKRALLEREARR
jgi:AraC family transcriptional regulator of adaptative response/methylated-DNA-[protein]-cysteine methyltransferase